MCPSTSSPSTAKRFDTAGMAGSSVDCCSMSPVSRPQSQSPLLVPPGTAKARSHDPISDGHTLATYALPPGQRLYREDESSFHILKVSTIMREPLDNSSNQL